MKWLTGRTAATFWRFIATAAVLILGGLAWYGLHREIESNRNPCFISAHSVACEEYVCHIGDILALRPSPSCRVILGLPTSKR